MLKNNIEELKNNKIMNIYVSERKVSIIAAILLFVSLLLLSISYVRVDSDYVDMAANIGAMLAKPVILICFIVYILLIVFTIMFTLTEFFSKKTIIIFGILSFILGLVIILVPCFFEEYVITFIGVLAGITTLASGVCYMINQHSLFI